MNEFEEYSDITSRLKDLKSVTPDSDFRSHFDVHLISALPDRNKKTIPLFGLSYRVALLVLIFLFAGSAGLGYAAERSEPGSLLYPVKQVIQEVRLAVTDNPSEKAKIQIEKSEDTVKEIEKAIDKNETDQLDEKVTDYSNTIESAVQDSKRTSAEAEDTAEHVGQSLNKNIEVLKKIQQTAPTQAQPALEKAVEASEKGQQTAEAAQENKPTSDDGKPGNNENNQSTEENKVNPNSQSGVDNANENKNR